MGFMWHFRWRLLLGIFVLTSITHAKDNKNDENSKKQQFSVSRFIYPATEDMHFYGQDILNISYYSNYKKPTLYLWCLFGDEVTKGLPISENMPSGDSWDVVRMPAGIDSDSCWFNLRSSDDEINSVPFALSSAEPTQVSRGAEAAETRSTSKPSTTRTTATTATTSQPTTESPRQTHLETQRTEEPSTSTSALPAPEGSSQTAAEQDKADEGNERNFNQTIGVGIAVGVSLGVLGFVAITAAVCMLRQRRSPRSTEHRPLEQNIEHHEPPDSSSSPKPPHPHRMPVYLVEWYDGPPKPHKVDRKSTLRFELP